MTESLRLALLNQIDVRFVFIRHGAASDVHGRYIGHTDSPLSSKGAGDIRALTFTVHNTVKLVSSDLARASDSAQIISEAINVPIEHDARLREMNFGEWDGRLWSELEQSDGERLSVWMDNWTTAAPPLGETVGMLVERVATWLRDQIQKLPGHHSTVIVVAHAGSIRAAICLLSGTPTANMFDIPVEHAHATVVEISKNSTTITANVSNVR